MQPNVDLFPLKNEVWPWSLTHNFDFENLESFVTEMKISGIALGKHIIMLKTQHVLSWLCIMVLFNLSKADVGTATSYNPPYIRKCQKKSVTDISWIGNILSQQLKVRNKMCIWSVTHETCLFDCYSFSLLWQW